MFDRFSLIPLPLGFRVFSLRPLLRLPERVEAAPCSSVAQRQSIRLLTGGLLVRIQPEEPTSLTKSGTSVSAKSPSGPLCPFLALFVLLPFGGVGGAGGGGSSRLTSAERNAG